MKKAVHMQRSTTNEDKKLNTVIRKYGVQPLGDIEEVNMFKDDNSVVHFKKPQVQFSARENLVVVSGASESKKLHELMPGIMQQIGPQQLGALQEFIKQATNAKGEEEDDDDAPPLVESGTFEAAAQKV